MATGNVTESSLALMRQDWAPRPFECACVHKHPQQTRPLYLGNVGADVKVIDVAVSDAGAVGCQGGAALAGDRQLQDVRDHGRHDPQTAVVDHDGPAAALHG